MSERSHAAFRYWMVSPEQVYAGVHETVTVAEQVAEPLPVAVPVYVVVFVGATDRLPERVTEPIP